MLSIDTNSETQISIGYSTVSIIHSFNTISKPSFLTCCAFMTSNKRFGLKMLNIFSSKINIDVYWRVFNVDLNFGIEIEFNPEWCICICFYEWAFHGTLETIIYCLASYKIRLPICFQEILKNESKPLNLNFFQSNSMKKAMKPI